MKLDFADLYYIPNFQFSNGATRDKYLLVLTEDDNDKLLLSLPTSIGRVPSHLEQGQFGCINCNTSQFNCYRFLSDVEVCDTSFSFPLDTYVYGEWIQDWSLSALRMDYAVDGVDYFYKGKLNHDLILDLINCFINSSKVKKKYKSILNDLYIKLTT